MRCLPRDFPKLDVRTSGDRAPAWYATAATFTPATPYAMVLDEHGTPVWYRRTTPPVIDVRSESEFAEDHIPGAISCPVLSDAERAEVGTMDRQQWSNNYPPLQRALFRMGQERASRVADITDGTSNSIALAEVLSGLGDTDVRASFYTARSGGQFLYVTTGPNSIKRSDSRPAMARTMSWSRPDRSSAALKPSRRSSTLRPGFCLIASSSASRISTTEGSGNAA